MNKRQRASLMAVSILVLSAGIATADEWVLESGANMTPGLFYNRFWDPGYNGTALIADLLYSHDRAFVSAGVETGYTYSGLNLLFPLRGGIRLAGSNSFHIAVQASILPGIMLHRPDPYFLMAVETALRLNREVKERYRLALILGPRYTFSPDYSRQVSPLEYLDLTIGLYWGRRWDT